MLVSTLEVCLTSQQIYNADYRLIIFSEQTLAKNKRNCKVHPITCHEGTEEKYRYNSTLSLTSSVDGGGGGGWSTPRPGRFAPDKTRYPSHRSLGGPLS
jgi:hypothetical protein